MPNQQAKKTGKLINKLGELLQPNGLGVVYHPFVINLMKHLQELQVTINKLKEKNLGKGEIQRDRNQDNEEHF